MEDFPTDTVTAILEYYSDKKLHHKSGSIDLTTCEEVYSALDSETYKHVFCVQVHFSYNTNNMNTNNNTVTENVDESRSRRVSNFFLCSS